MPSSSAEKPGNPGKPGKPIIAIDGPAGSGKSTVARMVASRLGFDYLDTGAMYRAVGVLAEAAGLSPEDESAVGKLARRLDFHFQTRPDGTQQVLVNGEDLTQAIRSRRADEWSSRVATLPEVRRALVEAQRRAVTSGQSLDRLRSTRSRPEHVEGGMVSPPRRIEPWSVAGRGWVVEGRDMQTAVFPEAQVKVFLTASLEERARRRLKDVEARGEQARLEELTEEVAERDRQDETRSLGPLRKAPDAVEVPTDGLSAEEVAERISRVFGSTSVRDPQTQRLADSKTSRLTPDPSASHPLFYLGRALWRVFFKVMGRWRIYGRENIPSSGGVIIAPNHVSYVDPPLAGGATERKTWFMAKSELFKIPILGPILPKVCAYPVKRGVPDREALRNTLELLAQGQVVTIFPEGTRSPDGTLQKPELGIASVALRSGAPVVPMAFIGSDRLLPRGSPIPRFARVTVRIGQPLRFAREQSPSREARQRVAEEVMSSIAGLIARGH